MKGMKRKGKSEERRGEKEEMGWLAVALGRGRWRRELFSLSSPIPFLPPLSPFGLLGVRQMGSIHYPSPSFHRAKEKGKRGRQIGGRSRRAVGWVILHSISGSEYDTNLGSPTKLYFDARHLGHSRLTTKTPLARAVHDCLSGPGNG